MVSKLIEIRPGMRIVDPREQKLPRAKETKEINTTVLAIIKKLSKKRK